ESLKLLIEAAEEGPAWRLRESRRRLVPWLRVRFHTGRGVCRIPRASPAGAGRGQGRGRARTTRRPAPTCAAGAARARARPSAPGRHARRRALAGAPPGRVPGHAALVRLAAAAGARRVGRACE